MPKLREKCNQEKGNSPLVEFLADKPDVLKAIKIQAKAPLADAAAVNSTRFAVVKADMKHGLVSCWTGGRTKFNRTSQNLIKTHAIDAACVGESGAKITLKTHQIMMVDCKGHGSRQARRNNASGFPVIIVKLDKTTGKKVVKVIEPKINYAHATAGDVVSCRLPKDRKHVKAGSYCSRVKTPTPRMS